MCFSFCIPVFGDILVFYYFSLVKRDKISLILDSRSFSTEGTIFIKHFRSTTDLVHLYTRYSFVCPGYG